MTMGELQRKADRALAARVVLIELVLPEGHRLGGELACQIRDAIDELERSVSKHARARARAGLEEEDDQPDPELGQVPTPEEAAAARAACDERTAELEAQRPRRGRK